MKAGPKVFVTLGVLLVCAAIALTPRFLARPRPAGLGDLSADVHPELSRGNPEAEVKIVEYIDFQCETCARTVAMMNDYFYTYPSRLYLEVRYHPLVDAHPHSLKSAIYAECASRQKKFWPFAEALFETQPEWAHAADPAASFHELGRKAGLDLAQLDACVEDPAVRQTVLDQRQEGLLKGVRLTPTFFVNGKMVVGLEGLKEELDAYFSKKGSG